MQSQPRKLAGLLCIVAAVWPLSALAGRPLATEDAGAESKGLCHLEAWTDHAEGVHSWVVSPACGLIDNLEMAVGWTAGQPKDEIGRGHEVAFKWIGPSPEGARWSWGAKAAWTITHLKDQETQRAGSWLVMGSWQPNSDWALHLNAGQQRDHLPAADGHRMHATAAAAVTYTPAERWLVFAETLAQAGGTPSVGVGARYWLSADTVALDVTVSRQTGMGGGSTAYTTGIGLGWYGITLWK